MKTRKENVRRLIHEFEDKETSKVSHLPNKF